MAESVQDMSNDDASFRHLPFIKLSTAEKEMG